MMNCPICRAQLIEKHEESSVVISCTNCEYSVVTTSISKIYEDDTIYSIILEKENKINKDTVSLLMNVTGLNVMEVSNIIKNEYSRELKKGKAPEIIELSTRLKEKGINYRIVPEFPWQEEK